MLSVLAYVGGGIDRHRVIVEAIELANRLGVPVTFEWNLHIFWTVKPGADPLTEYDELGKHYDRIAPCVTKV
jgi:hypothetical protein